jgi:copper resistance protein C
MNDRRLTMLTTLLTLAGVSPALAHAELASATPAVDARVQGAPTEISITFAEEVAPKFSAIEVLDAKGQRGDVGKAQTAPNDAKVLGVAVKPLTAGIYKVVWHVGRHS